MAGSSNTTNTWLGVTSVIFAITSAVLIYLYSNGEDEDKGYLGGLVFNSSNTFAWHPFLMTLGMIMFSIIALESYSILPLTHFMQKIVHSVAHTCALICFAMGLYCVVYAHNSGPYANLYSMHSWLGLAAAVVYAKQYLLGFFFFLSGTQSNELRRAYLPSHLSIGLFALCLSLGAALAGITEMDACSYEVESPDTNPASHFQNDMNAACKILQGAGICMIVSVLLAFYTLIPAKHKVDSSDKESEDVKSNLISPTTLGIESPILASRS